MNYQYSIDLSHYGLNSDEVKEVYTEVISLCPYCFCASNSISIVDSNLIFYYRYSKDIYSKRLSAVDDKINEIAEKAKAFSNNKMEQAKYVYDFLVNNTVYDISSEKYGIDDILIDGTGVCSAYSKSYSVILNRLGINCSCVVSKDKTHQWNVVTINGKSFYVDCSKGNNVRVYKTGTSDQYFNYYLIKNAQIEQ